MAYQETFVQRDQHRICVRDHPGAEPAIILMHGFPDNVHLYDRLSPYLSPPRRVVLFDFLGWGGPSLSLDSGRTACSRRDMLSRQPSQGRVTCQSSSDGGN
jgi:pimeloyl-ACP methyl ester carboxylesterase